LAFAGCTGLTSLTIGSGVNSIGYGAFNGCAGLTSVSSLAENPPHITYPVDFVEPGIPHLFSDEVYESVCLSVPDESADAYIAHSEWGKFNCVNGVETSVSSADRVIPPANPGEVAVVAPASQPAGEFTAGPNPAGRSSGGAAFFWRGKAIKGGSLTVYDAAGSVVRKITVTGDAIVGGGTAKRAVGSWDLSDRRGRPASEGSYLVKGVIKTSDGKGERVSLIVGVR